MDKQKKKDGYSSKKKAHRKKNLLLYSHARHVVYLGPTSSGSAHDKKLTDESGLAFPAAALVLKDTGFQGYEPPGAPTPQPTKKPRWRELYGWQKAVNTLVSQVRVGVEHTICGVKDAASSRTPSATCARASSTRPWNWPAACITYA